MTKYSTEKLNKELMPVANEIKAKMDGLAEKYNFNLDFAFKEIQVEEIIGQNKAE